MIIKYSQFSQIRKPMKAVVWQCQIVLIQVPVDGQGNARKFNAIQDGYHWK